MTAFKTTRRELLALIGGLAVFRAARSGAQDTFTLVPSLETGQVVNYRQDLQLVRDGVIGHRSRSTVTLAIRERVAGGWLARWMSSGGQLLEADPSVRPLLEVMQTMWDGVPIDLLLDDGGRVVGLADQAALRELGAKCLDRLLPLLLPDPTHAPVAHPLQRAMQSLLTKDGALAQSLLKEPAILLGAMGHDYCVGEPLEVSTRVRSPMSSVEIPVRGRYQVRGISSREGRAEIGWLMVIDRATAGLAVGAEILNFVRDVEATRPATTSNLEAPMSADAVIDITRTLELDDRGDFIIDTATAWPVSVRHVRRISTGTRTRIDTVELTRLAGQY